MSSNERFGLMWASGCSVVEGAGLEAAVQDADEAVGDLAWGGVVVGVAGALLVVAGAGAGRDADCGGGLRWTLMRIKKLIGRLFHIGYTVPGVWLLLRRNGWSAQRPMRRAIERDEAAIEVWKKEVWPQVEDPRRPQAPGSASKTKQAKG
ncbi:helix-turn-helix domain-containing protein [Nonomuraea aurantiaca]|uniref:helix-turn-helix domain-containing protein n=1 Tax=Nonomuraea aurantiaca TaxID=2878562 RepID=UPI001CD99903|nr:winged helix-turn-helix domain-containing protein [Nonomuraea aurantiaca]MCA2229422.1 winged helix-turn-helix domain-containing protein [Nonomuraea aurantiaca]